MGATFAFTEAFVANQRQKNDALNGAIGGCAAGFLAGIKSASFKISKYYSKLLLTFRTISATSIR